MLRCKIQILNKIPHNATHEELDFALLLFALGFGFSQILPGIILTTEKMGVKDVIYNLSSVHFSPLPTCAV